MWKELIARKLLLSIRTAASFIRDTPSGVGMSGSPTDPPFPGPVGGVLQDGIMSDAVAALAIIAGSSGVLYPGAAVRSK